MGWKTPTPDSAERPRCREPRYRVELHRVKVYWLQSLESRTGISTLRIIVMGSVTSMSRLGVGGRVADDQTGRGLTTFLRLKALRLVPIQYSTVQYSSSNSSRRRRSRSRTRCSSSCGSRSTATTMWTSFVHTMIHMMAPLSAPFRCWGATAGIL